MDELQHAGVKGMHWGFRKAVAAPPPGASTVSIQAQAISIARRDAGMVASRALLRKYGHQALPAAKVAIKGSVGLLRYSGRTLKGAGTAVRLLGGAVKVTSRFGKSYVKGALAVAKAVR